MIARFVLGWQPNPDQNEDTTDDIPADIYQLASELDGVFQASAQPADLLNQPKFHQAIEILTSPDISQDQVLGYARGDNNLLICVALAALKKRNEKPPRTDEVIALIGKTYAWQIYYALDYLADKPDDHMVVRVLGKIQHWWPNPAFFPEMIANFIKARLSRNESLEIGSHFDHLDDDELECMEQLLQSIPQVAESLVASLKKYKEHRLDRDYLKSIGRLMDSDSQKVVSHPVFERNLAQLRDWTLSTNPRSVMIVGESGCGKTTLVKHFAQQVQASGWTLFEVAARQIVAGQSYIGELEERVLKMCEKATRSRKVIWFIPDCHELLLAGAHRFSHGGVLDMLLPYVDEQQILVIGETTPSAYEQLARQKPRVKQSLEPLNMQPMSKPEAIDLLGQVFESEKDLMTEAVEMATMYLADTELPGNAMRLVRATQERLAKSCAPFTAQELLTSLSQLTGLPVALLDDRVPLDLEVVRHTFLKRVLGQNDAVDVLVDRIAMVKAGVTDPLRPLGVFMFVGPTGTGKTELAKTLAELLFGSENRIVRFDMSEFKTADAISRILGGSDEQRQQVSLTTSIRQQPFSVILLDEFEKAHPNIWDLFLQVFDDGRLTDVAGRTVDFRYTMIIMTSNLGAAVPSGMSIGFSGDQGTFSAHQVMKAMATTFRREFMNRIDHITVFRPLSRQTMRQILYHELDRALMRRGLKSKSWAVEWEPSAIEFLLDKGFTQDLGARPLRRAIEHHLLAPLARTIVSRSTPEGDQFLFVRALGDQLQVEFVDPNQEDQESTADSSPSLSLAQISWQPSASPAVIDLLNTHLQALEHRINDQAWQKDKDQLLSQINQSGFWNRPDRFNTLEAFEVRDRLEMVCRTLTSLAKRIKPGSASQPVVEMAHRLRMLPQAMDDISSGLSQDACLWIEWDSSHDPHPFAERLKDMYLGWAASRGIRASVMPLPKARLMTMIGLGAYAVLKSETGLHIWETGERPKQRERIQVRVWVVRHLPGTELTPELLNQLMSDSRPQSWEIVRRYREQPSPLIRDTKHGWRTGKLDKVLAGDFDCVPNTKP
ncbi:MAG: AAA family ATPase [Acidobacteria bacterium]|nr:AAA family ATPase [Acidobacteriota bacterium]